MKTIKVNLDNLINLISNLLIRLRTEDQTYVETIQDDIYSFVEFLEKFSGDKKEVLFDKNFITSKEELGRLDEVIKTRIPEIKSFKKLLEEIKNDPSYLEVNKESVKEYLRKIAAAFISLKNKNNYQVISDSNSNIDFLEKYLIIELFEKIIRIKKFIRTAYEQEKKESDKQLLDLYNSALSFISDQLNYFCKNLPEQINDGNIFDKEKEVVQND